MYHRTGPLVAARLTALVNVDLHKATDDDDLTRRLARNGLGFHGTPRGRMLITLPQRVELFAIDPRPQTRH